MKSERNCKVRWKVLVRVFISFASSCNNASNDFVNGGGLSGLGGIHSQYLRCYLNRSRPVEDCGIMDMSKMCPTAFAIFHFI